MKKKILLNILLFLLIFGCVLSAQFFALSQRHHQQYFNQTAVSAYLNRSLSNLAGAFKPTWQFPAQAKELLLPNPKALAGIISELKQIDQRFQRGPDFEPGQVTAPLASEPYIQQTVVTLHRQDKTPAATTTQLLSTQPTQSISTQPSQDKTARPDEGGLVVEVKVDVPAPAHGLAYLNWPVYTPVDIAKLSDAQLSRRQEELIGLLNQGPPPELSEQMAKAYAQAAPKLAPASLEELNKLAQNYPDLDFGLSLSNTPEGILNKLLPQESAFKLRPIHLIDYSLFRQKILALPESGEQVSDFAKNVDVRDARAPFYSYVLSATPKPLPPAGSELARLQAEDAWWLAIVQWGTPFDWLCLSLTCFALGLVVFGFLLSLAGRKGWREPRHSSWLERIPYGLYGLLAVGLPLTVLISGIDLLNHGAVYLHNLSNWLVLWLFGFSLSLMFLVALAMSTYVRLATRGFWRNTLLYYLFIYLVRPIYRFVAGLPRTGVYLLLTAFWLLAVLLLGLNERRAALIWLLFSFLYILYVAVLRHWLLKSLAESAQGNFVHPLPPVPLLPPDRAALANLQRIESGHSEALEARVKSERLKTELIANVSHDIKTPLTTILNYTQLLESEEAKGAAADPLKKADYFQTIRRQTERLKKLVEDLIEASKASSHSYNLQLEPLDLAVFVQQMLGEFSERFTERRLQVLQELPTGLPAVAADPERLARVLENLCTNISRYALPGSRVYASLYDEGQELRLHLANISEAPLNIPLEELMDRFVRGDQARSTEGSGLGLAICKDLVEAMGGRFAIGIQNDLFTVDLSLPKALATTAESQA